MRKFAKSEPKVTDIPTKWPEDSKSVGLTLLNDDRLSESKLNLLKVLLSSDDFAL